MFERVRGAAALGVAALAAALTAVFIAPVSAVPTITSSSVDASQPEAAAEQVLTWTADDSVTEYASFPTTATAGPATIVFENSEATGNTTYMTHTLTFDTTNPEYNQDVDVDIVASPNDPNGGRHEVQVNLSPGTYRYYCAIPGHSAMSGILVVTDGGGDDTTPPEVSAEVSGDQDADGNFVGSATVTVSASDAGSGVASVEYDLDGAGFVEYTDPVTVDVVGDHSVQFRATDVAGNVSEVGSVAFTVVEAEPGDSTPPEVSAEVSGDQDADGNYVGSATVTLDASDAGSGVASVEYDLDGAGFVEYTDPVTVDAVGDHTVQYRATDVAGNVSEVGSVAFTVVAGEPGTCSGDDRDTVWLRGVDTGVPNYDAGEGCTVNDLIEDERDWAEHGAFVRHVGDVTADLVEDGVLTSRERSTLVRAAASSEIGKPGDVKVARSLVQS